MNAASTAIKNLHQSVISSEARNLGFTIRPPGKISPCGRNDKECVYTIQNVGVYPRPPRALSFELSFNGERTTALWD